MRANRIFLPVLPLLGSVTIDVVWIVIVTVVRVTKVCRVVPFTCKHHLTLAIYLPYHTIS